MLSSNFTARFGEVIVRSGIASIPDAVFSFQKELGLSVGECWFIAQILRFKWTTELPKPSLKKMADYTGVSVRTLHNYKNSLIEKGYLRIINRTDEQGRQTTNYYDFTGLFERIIKILSSKEEPETNPFEEDILETGEEDYKEREGENFAQGGGKIFTLGGEKISPWRVKKQHPYKQNNKETEEYETEEYINNNPPNGGTNSQPSAGVVVEINEQYKKITGRDKVSFFAALLEEYPAEKVMNAVAYLEKAMLRGKIDNPEGFIISALRENWDTQPFEQEQKLKKEFTPPRNYFNSYTQRTYDVEELERRLLEHSRKEFFSNKELLEMDEETLFDDSS
ncbi:helix-turn-helix domain-containing protein [Thermoanaerobacter siderophilus]|uniref:DnaD N-terminal domain-containing protein n=1 Tax=Thermoanaerobacter siderophilus SR4 TaxID=880478 RepID=I9KT17_9THEO|nr:helix-turn-helix domain-containing protein [Thermoanaerobacter siderophilus]EIV99955.1 hypothetical protein ThesiDRAFT1_0973 [Thermoanaerobacter siderophilus SR4]